MNLHDEWRAQRAAMNGPSWTWRQVVGWTGVVVALLVFIAARGAVQQKAQPADTEILPADYAKCRPKFSLCKGKFIKFEGTVTSLDAKTIRIKTPMHGFDVTMIEKPDQAILGAKVLFSGYLAGLDLLGPMTEIPSYSFTQLTVTLS